MRSENRKKGDMGEAIASKWLEANKNFKILTRNYSTRYGEIDIIAQDNDVYVFVEVKYRCGNAHGYPYEAVTSSKQNKIAKSALCYMQEKGLDSTTPVRFDVVEIIENRIDDRIDDRKYIRHTENAFEWSN
ncbi:MAG: YraN family protein [Candidatus Metalachnospira sp.]|nr:YraN family protein [Candidatus Metalachnospira sp.]